MKNILESVIKLLSKDQIQDLLRGKAYFYQINGEKYAVIDAETVKVAAGKDYNYIFNKVNGNFMRWGETYEVDPEFSPIGGEILDIEVTTSCNGINGSLCQFCYKSNTPNGKNMSLETFKSILDKIGIQLTQVAFGADSQATSNPDLFEMAQYCRKKGIVPNITVANVSDEIADKLASVMGAVAVSKYSDKNVCYNSIKKLTDRGMTQVNMHFCIMDESYENCLETLNDIRNDPRLKKLNAIVLLSLKQKGRGINFTPLSHEKYQNIVNICLKNNINFGMDSCGAKKFLDSVKNHPNYEKFKLVCEPCESTNFSQYIDVKGDFYPCSFCDGAENWNKGISAIDTKDFLKNIWYNDRVVAFREKLNSNCNNCHNARECPIYQI